MTLTTTGELRRRRDEPLRGAQPAREAILHLDRDWPSAGDFTAAFTRLQARPPPTR